MLSSNITHELNLSDHSAIEMTFNLNVQNLSFSTVPNDVPFNENIYRLRWDHANLMLYYSACYTELLPLLNYVDGLYSELMSEKSGTLPNLKYYNFNHQNEAINLI